MDRLYTEAEAAALSRLSARTLRSLRAEGKIRYIRVSPRRIAYSEAQLVDFIKCHTVEVRSPVRIPTRKVVSRRK